MGIMADAMQNAVDQIGAADQARRAALDEVLDGGRQGLADARAAHARAAAALRDRLSGERKKRAAEERSRGKRAGEFRDELEAALEDSAVKVSELRSDARNLVERDRLEREDMASALLKELAAVRKGRASEESTRRKEARRSRAETRRALEELATHVSELRSDGQELLERYRRELGKTAADVAAAARIWRRRPTKGAPARVVRKRARRPAAPPRAKKPATLEERVLAVIGRHPEGIRLPEIGNQLGVNWRSLIGPTKALLEARKIEKTNTTYHPAD